MLTRRELLKRAALTPILVAFAPVPDVLWTDISEIANFEFNEDNLKCLYQNGHHIGWTKDITFQINYMP